MISHLFTPQAAPANLLRGEATCKLTYTYKVVFTILVVGFIGGFALPSRAADVMSITGVREEGRVIFRNDQIAAASRLSPAANSNDGAGVSFRPSPQASRRRSARVLSPVANSSAPLTAISAQSAPEQAPGDLVYWSKQEGRWKQVPRISNATMRRAISAASEIRPLTHAGARGRRSASAVEADGLGLRGRGTSGQVDKAIEEAALRHQVDPDLVRALIQVESNFNPRARSHKGAMGLMQLMPATARSLNVRNAFDARQNLDGGVKHLAGLLQSYDGNVELSLAAYNAGAGAVQRHNGIPPYAETQNYVRRITAIYGQHGGSFRTIGEASAPIHVLRDAAGHKVFSNTD